MLFAAKEVKNEASKGEQNRKMPTNYCLSGKGGGLLSGKIF